MFDQFPRALAIAFLGGPWNSDDLAARGAATLGVEGPWLSDLAQRVIALFPAPPLHDEAALIEVLATDRRLAWKLSCSKAPLPVPRWWVAEPSMVAIDGPPSKFAVPPLPSLEKLAGHLRVNPGDLAWFADLRNMNARTRTEPLLHYRCAWVAKARGGHRLLEAPKLRLKNIQRWILRHVLAAIPVSSHAHGFVSGRGVRSFVEPHTGSAVVLHLDIRDFFASISRARVAAIYRRVGYPRAVVATLTGLCTIRTPECVLERRPGTREGTTQRFEANQRLREPHLPQGAPTSPGLANLAAWYLDQRLAGLATAYGATMTRYADDIAFSGDRSFARRLSSFVPKVAAIALEEGFALHPEKTRVMRQGRRQQLCGLVVNQRPNLPRREIDNLRALLFNAGRFGAESQNRNGHADFRRHLEGRIAWVTSINPDTGARLTALFERIRWE